MLYIITSIINKYSVTLLYVNNEYTYTYEYKTEYDDPDLLDGLYIGKHLAYNWRTRVRYTGNCIYTISNRRPVQTNYNIPARMEEEYSCHIYDANRNRNDF